MKTVEDFFEDIKNTTYYRDNGAKLENNFDYYDVIAFARQYSEYVAQYRSLPITDDELKSFAQLLKEWGDSHCGRNEAAYIYDLYLVPANQILKQQAQEIERLKASLKSEVEVNRVLRNCSEKDGQHIKELEARMDKMVSGDNYTKVTTALQEEIERLKEQLETHDKCDEIEWNYNPRTIKLEQRIKELEAQLNYVKTWIKSNNEGHNVSFDFSKIESSPIEQPSPIQKAVMSEDYYEPEAPQQEEQNDFLLHLVDVVSCFVMEQNNFLATPVRLDLIKQARESYNTRKPL